MNKVKDIFYKISGLFAPSIPFRALQKMSGQNLLLPFYHTISDEPLPHIRNLYKIKTIDAFNTDLDFILKYFEPISHYDLMQSVTGNIKIKKNSFLLSFDDGLSESISVIAPELKRRGIPAIFFINTAFIDNRALFYRYKVSLLLDRIQSKGIKENETNAVKEITDSNEITKWLLRADYSQTRKIDKIAILLKVDFPKYLANKKPYLTSEEILELQSMGFGIGAHSVDHPEFWKLGLGEQVMQAEDSTKIIQKLFSPAANLFAFPFTDSGISQAFFDTIAKNEIIDITFGGAGLKKENNPRHFQRIPMEAFHVNAEILLKSEYLYYLLKSPIGKNRIRRK